MTANNLSGRDGFSSDWRFVIRVVLGLCIVVGIYIRWAWGADFTYVSFTDRDLLRGLFLWDEFQYLGSELGGQFSEKGGSIARTPGGGLSYFNNALQAISPDTKFIHGTVVFMDCVALIAVPFLFGPVLGRTAALFSAALYSVAPSVLQNIWKFWNPSYVLLFGMLIYYLLLTYRGPENKYRLIAAFALISVAAQFHVSFYYLLPLTVLFLILMRKRVSVATALGSVAAFLGVLLPYFVLDGANGFETIRSIYSTLSQDALPPGEAEVEWLQRAGIVAWKIINGLSHLTGGRVFTVGLLPAAIENNAILFLGTLFVFNIGIILVIAYIPIALYRMAKAPETAPGGIAADVLKGLLFLFLVAAVSTGITNSQAGGRYVLFIIWPGVLLAGVGFQEIMGAVSRRLSRPRPRHLVGALALAISLVPLARAGAFAYYYGYSERETQSSYGVKETLVRALEKEFGYSDWELDTRVALIIRKDGKLRFWDHGENTSWSYISRSAKPSPTSGRYDGCALVVADYRRGVPPPRVDARTIASLLPFSEGLKIERSFSPSPDLRVIGYRIDGGNCPVSFTNAYLVTGDEKMIEAEAASLSQGAVRKLDGPEGGRRYITVLKAGAPVPVMVELTPGDGSVGAAVQGNALRGYAPGFAITRATLTNLRLRFTPTGESGEAVDLHGPDLLGANGIYTPWNMGPIDLAPGVYRVDLVTQSVWTLNGQSGPVTVQLEGRLQIPGL